MFLVFNFTRHTQQTSPLMYLEFFVSVCYWVSSCFYSELIRASSQSRHDLSCLCVVMFEIWFEFEFVFQCDVCAKFWFAFFLAILFPLSCEFSLSMLYPMLSHRNLAFLAAIFPPCPALSAVCVCIRTICLPHSVRDCAYTCLT